MSSDMLDGSLYKMIPHRHAHIVNDARLEPPECVVEEGEVWVVDMVMSTGDGAARMRRSLSLCLSVSLSLALSLFFLSLFLSLSLSLSFSLFLSLSLSFSLSLFLSFSSNQPALLT